MSFRFITDEQLAEFRKKEQQKTEAALKKIEEEFLDALSKLPPGCYMSLKPTREELLRVFRREGVFHFLMTKNYKLEVTKNYISYVFTRLNIVALRIGVVYRPEERLTQQMEINACVYVYLGGDKRNWWMYKIPLLGRVKTFRLALECVEEKLK